VTDAVRTGPRIEGAPVAATGVPPGAPDRYDPASRVEAPPVTDPRLAGRSIDTIRTLAMDAVEAAACGHPGTPMALAPLAYVLWTRVMKYCPSAPDWPDRDRFVLSAGHASMLLYASLHLAGYDVSLDDLKAFRQWGSKTPGHPEAGHTPGVETTTGPLGQGFGNAVGMALAERMLAARFNRPGHEVVNHRTWVIASDGDLMEGVASEAASLAGHLGLSRLCVFYDDNRITIDGPTSLAFTEDVGRRFQAYGWNVVRLADDATLDQVEAAARAAVAETERPTLVVCRTHIGYGAPTKQDTAKAHGEALGPEEVRGAKRRYGWPEDAHFLVPDDVAAHLRAEGGRGDAARAAWTQRVAAYGAAYPDDAKAFADALAGRLPAGWEEALSKVVLPSKPTATRKASGLAIQALAPVVPGLVGGSADLAGSNNTPIPGGGDVQRGAYGGRNLSFGVREHAMGAMLNGLALHGGFRPYGGTFLVFSDYMRPSIRLAALMRLPVVYVFTHDSVGLGEDGPTHQPVEHLASLRAMPGLTVFRPADAAETIEAWRFAIAHAGPVALALTRQDVPAIDRAAPRRGAASLARRGAYVLEDADGPPALVLLASGSEVSVALAAASRLRAEGVAVRVVSCPSLCVFGRQDAAYRDSVLPPGVPRVSVEAGTTFGWARWVGERGRSVGIDRFGASAPGARVLSELGITPQRVVDVALGLLARPG
jgi:transketolase